MTKVLRTDPLYQAHFTEVCPWTSGLDVKAATSASTLLLSSTLYKT